MHAVRVVELTAGSIVVHCAVELPLAASAKRSTDGSAVRQGPGCVEERPLVQLRIRSVRLGFGGDIGGPLVAGARSN